MALDVFKGFVPALLATIYVGHLAGVLAGGAAMLGHWRPLFLRFARGGTAAISLPVASVVLGEPWPVDVFAAAAALAVIVLHRPNIARLRAGTETRFRFRRRAVTS